MTTKVNTTGKKCMTMDITNQAERKESISEKRKTMTKAKPVAEADDDENRKSLPIPQELKWRQRNKLRSQNDLPDSLHFLQTLIGNINSFATKM